jgi:F-box/leucine-rich repeat protein 2/20
MTSTNSSSLHQLTPAAPASQGEEHRRVADHSTKGKAASQPVPIRPSAALQDLFDATTPNSSFHPANPFSPEFDEAGLTTIDPALVHDLYHSDDMPFSFPPVSSKGKQKDEAPTLPPLSFVDMGFGYEDTSWSSFGSVSPPGPSSYGSISHPVPDNTSPPSADEAPVAQSSTSVTSVDGIYANTSPSKHMPSRCRSLSNLSLRRTPSLASLTMSKIRVKLGPTTTQSNLARKLLRGKRGDTTPDSGASSETASIAANAEGVSAVTSSPSLDPTVVPWYAAPLQYDLDTAVPPSFVRPRAGTENKIKQRPSLLMLKTKGRSRSSPMPFSTLDFVPATATDVFKPLPLLRRNYIDQILPKELQLQILKSFVHLFEDDHAKAVAEGRWTISKAISSRNRVVGRDRGIRELLKLARVSRL